MLPNQTEVIKRLSELSRMLDKATEEIAILDHDYVVKKQAYEMGYSSAFIQSTGSMDIRKHEALLSNGELRFQMELAEQVLRACKERINTLRAQISIGQSVSAALRQSFSAEATGQYT